MLECEHGDHPSYMFPVRVSEIDEVDIHALIFSDGTVALTLHEGCYFLWRVETGTLLHGPKWVDRKDCRVTALDGGPLATALKLKTASSDDPAFP